MDDQVVQPLKAEVIISLASDNGSPVVQRVGTINDQDLSFDRIQLSELIVRVANEVDLEDCCPMSLGDLVDTYTSAANGKCFCGFNDINRLYGEFFDDDCDLERLETATEFSDVLSCYIEKDLFERIVLSYVKNAIETPFNMDIFISTMKEFISSLKPENARVHESSGQNHEYGIIPAFKDSEPMPHVIWVIDRQDFDERYYNQVGACVLPTKEQALRFSATIAISKIIDENGNDELFEDSYSKEMIEYLFGIETRDISQILADWMESYDYCFGISPISEFDFGDLGMLYKKAEEAADLINSFIDRKEEEREAAEKEEEEKVLKDSLKDVPLDILLEEIRSRR